MHEAGLWARHLYPSLRATLADLEPAAPAPSEGLVVETLRVAGLLHDVGHGPFAHFFDDHVLAAFPAPADDRRPGAKALTHEDLSQLIIERELGDAHRRPAPGAGDARRSATPSPRARRSTRAGSRSSSPSRRCPTPAMPRWVRWLQPLLSGVFTVDNLDYVRRDAYLTGVATGPVDVERLRRYCFIGGRGPDPLRAGARGAGDVPHGPPVHVPQVYFHRTVRAIDLDLAEVFGPSIRAIFGDASPADALSAYADLDEYALLHQAALWARGEALSATPGPGDGTGRPDRRRGVAGDPPARPRWRAEAEVRADFEAGDSPTTAVAALGPAEPGRVDDRPRGGRRAPGRRHRHGSLLALEGRDGGVRRRRSTIRWGGCPPTR